MRLSELKRQLDDIAVKVGPDLDPEVIIKSEQPWKFLRGVKTGKLSTITAVKDIIVLK